MRARLQRLVGPAGPWLNRAAALLLAAWGAHAVLRAALLFRNDGFGYPLVGKADWYIFHALFIDLHWITLTALPFLIALGLLARLPRSGPRLCAAVFALLAVFHAVLLPVTVIDHETLRFMGMHFDPGLLRTYGNGASIREIFTYLAHDASVKGLPYLLFFGSIPFAAGLYALISRARWARRDAWSPGPWITILVTCLVGYVYVYHLWTGGNRMRKLRPFVQTAWQSLWSDAGTSLKADELARLESRYREAWLAASSDTNWTFPYPDYPYYRVPRNPVSAPGGKPWNFVLILMESHRAMHVGHLNPYGSTRAATPFLDSLAHTNHYWTRMTASGVPTINALLSVHLSIPPHPTRQLASEFATLRNEGFPAVFGRAGYVTRFFSAADPAWDNQTPWLRQWYQGVHYDRSRENDGAMFADMAAWMRDSLSDDKPFFVTAMTKSNHYPFNPAPGMPEPAADAPLTERMTGTMGYADSCLRAFFAAARTRPWYDRTVFVILADHGFPLSEHGSSQIGYGLYTESVWLPLVIVGSHPALGPKGPHDALAAQVDLAPTFFDLAGLKVANAQVGHSLVSPGPADRQFRFTMLGEQAFVEKGPYRWHGAWGAVPREQGEELFDVIQDRLEHRNLLAPAAERGDLAGLRDSLSAWARDLARLNLHVIERDALWPPDSLARARSRVR
jgi:hypothetical protein